MDEKELELREQIGRVAHEFLERDDATGWFDELYKQAGGDIDAIPWADLEPNRFLVEWDGGTLSDGAGKKALVVGCGLGDEAKYLADRGFEVTAFDISPKAIEWAKRVHEAKNIEFLVADMFDPPAEWDRAFDLVVEVYTIQALPIGLREKSIRSISSFVALGGELVVVQRLRADNISDPDGPPWALSRAELKMFVDQGLKEVEFETFFGDEEEPIERFVSLYWRVS